MVTRSGGLYRVSRGYSWRVVYLSYISFNELDLMLGFSWQIRRAWDALGRAGRLLGELNLCRGYDICRSEGR